MALTDRHLGEIASWLLPYDPSAHVLKALDGNLGDGGYFKDIATIQSARVAWKQAAFGDVISLKSATVAIRFKLPRCLRWPFVSIRLWLGSPHSTPSAAHTSCFVIGGRLRFMGKSLLAKPEEITGFPPFRHSAP